MIGLLLKNWKLILDIILVIALVVWVFIWNPFGIFGGGLKLSPTTNMVTEVREMGQLVTAEYYGEVIASIEESRLNYIESDEIGEQAAKVYEDLYAGLRNLYAFQEKPEEEREAMYRAQEPIKGWKRIIRQEVSRRNIVDKLVYHQYLGDLSMEPMYEEVLEHIWWKKNNKPWDGSTTDKEEALLLLYSEMGTNGPSSLVIEDFIQFYYSKQESAISRKEKKKKLAMIGRGWVKAGFDFSQMDNNTFYINEEAGEMHFFGLSAVILNADINPWFIPEKGIPGFQILEHNGKVDFRDAKKVKQYCVDKLVLSAHRAKILESAELNGAETLKSLFSLMTGKEIKKVFFHQDRIIRLSEEIASDEWVNYQEASLLDSTLRQEWKEIDSLSNTRENSYKNKQLAQHRRENVKAVLNQLQQLPFEDLPGTFNYYSKTAFEIAQDSILDKNERELLEKMRQLKTDEKNNQNATPIESWYQDTLSLAGHFNSALSYLLNRGVLTGTVADTTLSITAFTTDFLASHRVVQYAQIEPDEITAGIFTEEEDPQKILYELLYPYDYGTETWNQTMSRKKIILDSIAFTGNETIKGNDSTTLVYHALGNPHIKRINLPLNKLVNPLLLKRYPDSPVLWTSENFGFIINDGFGEALKNGQITLFTDRQAAEMEKYYLLLLNSHKSIKNKGPFVRANEWMKKKFENNKPLKKWLSEMKNKIVD